MKNSKNSNNNGSLSLLDEMNLKKKIDQQKRCSMMVYACLYMKSVDKSLLNLTIKNDQIWNHIHYTSSNREDTLILMFNFSISSLGALSSFREQFVCSGFILLYFCLPIYTFKLLFSDFSVLFGFHQAKKS